MDVEPEVRLRVRDLFTHDDPVDIRYDTSTPDFPHLVVGIIRDGIEYTFHLVDERNAD